MMKRHQDWPIRLARFLQAASKRPFSWGETDCALLTADWVLEATGRDPAAAFRGQYTTQLGAARALARLGSGDLETTASLMLGPPLDNPLEARRGDVCSIATDEGPALGVCAGAYVAVVTPTEGWGVHPLTSILKAWRV